MKRILALSTLLLLCLLPISAMAGSFTWATPWSSGAISSNSSSTLDSNGSVTANTTSIGWNFNLDTSANTVSGAATVNGQDYSATFDWSNFLFWLFG